MINDLAALEIFLKLCETGSVQGTARELGLDNATVSKKIAKLERALGRQLFDKTRRPFVMTRDARAIVDSARRIHEEKARIEKYYRTLQDDEMVVRMMVGNAQIHITARLIDEYVRLRPNMRFNIISPPDVDEFMAGKADLINLSGQAELTGCVELPRARMVFVPVASRDYVREHGPIGHPEELQNHRVFSNLYPHRFDFEIHYPLVKNGVSTSFAAVETVRYSNVLMMCEAVRNGAGVAPCMPLSLCIDDLERGVLVPVLEGWHRPCRNSTLACKADDWKIRHLRVFASWWAKRTAAYERDCERRLEACLGRAFLQNLLH